MLGFPGHGSTSTGGGDEAFLIFDGIGQLVGLAGMVFGMVHSHQVLVFNEYVQNGTSRTLASRTPSRPIWSVIPAAPGASAGVSLSITRF
jgi:hypothetical protein